MDYRVIFKSSSAPQIFASAAGDIIACCDIYLNNGVQHQKECLKLCWERSFLQEDACLILPHGNINDNKLVKLNKLNPSPPKP